MTFTLAELEALYLGPTILDTSRQRDSIPFNVRVGVAPALEAEQGFITYTDMDGVIRVLPCG